MKIKSNEFRVGEGDEVHLDTWPTSIAPVYASKKHYHESLEEHVGQLSALQQLLYASNSCAVLIDDLSGGGCGRQGRCHQTRDVGRQPARLSGLQLQAPKCARAAARLFLAHHTASAGTRSDRHLQKIILRGDAHCPGKSLSSAGFLSICGFTANVRNGSQTTFPRRRGVVRSNVKSSRSRISMTANHAKAGSSAFNTEVCIGPSAECFFGSSILARKVLLHSFRSGHFVLHLVAGE
jgi:hypothetical protein